MQYKYAALIRQYNRMSKKNPHLLQHMNHKYAIVIATYHRSNGKTAVYLERSMGSILNQTCKDWDLILVGDKYEPANELDNVVKKFRTKIAAAGKKNKLILLHNNKTERDFIKNKDKLWCCGGANSMNMGLNYARLANYWYYLHLDDDDYWQPNHIEEINKIYLRFKSCIFVATKSVYLGSMLPNIDIPVYENNMLPTPGGMIHSSFSFRLDAIKKCYETSMDENKIRAPSDALLLEEIRQFITENKQYCAIYTPVLTCIHETEGQIKN